MTSELLITFGGSIDCINEFIASIFSVTPVGPVPDFNFNGQGTRRNKDNHFVCRRGVQPEVLMVAPNERRLDWQLIGFSIQVELNIRENSFAGVVSK